MLARRFFIFFASLPFLMAAGPVDVSRVLKSIDFEERRLGNHEDLPMHWLKVEGPGLPNYVNGKLSDDSAHSGQWSFRFDLNGGSLVYRYDPKEVPINTGAHYHVACFVQTTVLPHARARLSAYFTDQDGNPIDGSMTHSELYAAKNEGEGEGWHELSLELSSQNPNAALLAVQLELLQPS